MGKPQTPPLPLWLIGFRNETLEPSLYHILLPHLLSCVVIAQLHRQTWASWALRAVFWIKCAIVAMASRLQQRTE